MKRLTIALLCAFCMSTSMAWVTAGERAVTSLCVINNGTVTSTTPLTNLCTYATYVDLASMYVMSTNGATATIAVSTSVDGATTELFDIPFVAGTSTNIVKTLKEYSPRRSVFSSSNPDTDKYRLLGTNTVLTITQTVATTNSYDITLLYEKD